MNKKGMAFLIYFMIGVVCFVLGMALAPSLTETSNEAQTALNCSSSSISNQDKAVCYQMDVTPPFYIGILFGIAGIILTRMVI